MQNKPNIKDVRATIPTATFQGEIGEGGFKVVYRAVVNGCIEAVKLTRIPMDASDVTVEETNRQRLKRELNLLAQCQSLYLVKLGQLKPCDCHIDGYKYVCYSEELIEGESLRTRIRKGNCPNQGELATLGICMLSAVEELAAKNAIHRDIKPDNIIAAPNVERPFILLDLGLAFIVGGTDLTKDSLAIPGTRYYLAPEMLNLGFRKSLDYRADLYTIGLTLYEYASRLNPFADPGDSVLNTMYRIRHQKPQPLKELRDDLDIDFCKLVDQLIKKMPALRPANLSQLIKRLEGYK